MISFSFISYLSRRGMGGSGVFKLRGEERERKIIRDGIRVKVYKLRVMFFSFIYLFIYFLSVKVKAGGV